MYSTEQIFTDLFSKDAYLVGTGQKPVPAKNMAIALLCRGQIEVSDVRNNIEKYFSCLV